jgi:hypothetical protein
VQLWEERLQYFDEDGKPIKASEESIIVHPYPLVTRVRNITWLYAPANQSRNIQLEDNEDKLETVELVDLHDLLSKISLYNPEERVSLQDAISILSIIFHSRNMIELRILVAKRRDTALHLSHISVFSLL